MKTRAYAVPVLLGSVNPGGARTKKADYYENEGRRPQLTLRVEMDAGTLELNNE